MTHTNNNILNHCQLAVEVAAFVVLALVSQRLFLTADAVSIVLSLVIAYSVPRWLYTSRSWASSVGRWVFMALGLAMTALAVYTIWTTTVAVGHTLAEPLLTSDDSSYYSWALHHYDGRCPEPEMAFPGLPLIMLWMWRVLGVSVVWPLAMNVLFTLLTVVVVAALTVRLLGGVTRQGATWHAAMALCLTASLAFFVSQGLRVQKEAIVYLSIALIGYVLAGMNAKSRQSSRPLWRDVLLWCVACLLLAMARTTYLYFALLGLAIVAFSSWRTHGRRLGVLTLLALAAFVLGNFFARYSIGGHFDIVKGGYHMQQAFAINGPQQPYLDLIGNYFMYPVWKRLAILPLACCVQFVIPFPWVYNNFDVLNLLPRIAFGWYAVGGTVLFYYLMMLTRRGRMLGVGAWGWWPLCIYVVIAYVVAGSVSRYLLPVEPMAVPLAVLVVARLRECHWRKAFTWWAVAFVLVLTVVLVICYNVQLSYLHELDDYYQSLMQ